VLLSANAVMAQEMQVAKTKYIGTTEKALNVAVASSSIDN
jgi:hypothetical protein